MSLPRAGIVRIASPARPAAATNVVANTATDPVTNEAPAVAFGATNGVHASVPRSISVSDIHCVVTPEDSMKSRNGGLIRPSMHERDDPPQHRQHDAHRPPRGEPQPQPVGPVTGQPDRRGQAAGQRGHGVDRTHQRDRQRRPGGQHPHGAVVDCAAAAVRPRSARITGSSTHGASIIGSVSEEIAPSVVSTRGDSANAAAAMTRDVGLPMPQRLGDPQQTPETDGEQQRPPQPLGHPARQPEHVAEQEEGAVRKQVAIGLVLRLAERQLAVPQVERAGEEPQRIRGQVELGVGRDLSG